MPNKQRFKEIAGSICAPRGFRAAAVFCDIKKLGTGKGSEKGRKNDLALIVSDAPAAVAGMFTTNQTCAAPVKISSPRAARSLARAIVVNSGNANACTGKQGLRDAETMTQIAAHAVAAVYSSHRNSAKADDRRKNSLRPSLTDRPYKKIRAQEVLVCSTGRIGVPMPMNNVACGIRECAPLLTRSEQNARQAAEAIMTTDTRRKEIAVEFKIGQSTVRIGGICKGAGMIAPGMAATGSVATGLARSGSVRSAGLWPVRTGAGRTAHRAVAAGAGHATMLAFITSDVAIKPSLLRGALENAVVQSFNRITVDGDMSTNDSVIMLANGMAKNSKLEIRNSKFENALNYVCLELAKMIVRDGEGTSRVVRLIVRGATNDRDAESAARAIANSSLVRTSWCGGDPNWGRILCALGYSKARVNEDKVDVGYAGPGSRRILFAFRRGRPTNVALNTLAKMTLLREFDLYVDLHLGRSEFSMYAADLTEDYVAFNKGDVTDPTTLGG
jgi:glutamate N-acetyltransferase / amino-acid N-acetyltransferase